MKRLLALVLLLIAATTFCLPAMAVWPFKGDEKKKEYTPPDENQLVDKCEPLREHVVELNQKNKVVHPLYRPKIGYLKSKHQKCVQKFMDQEREYLRHSEEPPPEVSPSLPPLNIPPEAAVTPETATTDPATPETPTVNAVQRETPAAPAAEKRSSIWDKFKPKKEEPAQ